jgi:hypothetical protein
MYLHERPKGERVKTDLLALHLIEIAIGAGWKSGVCVKFAREAYEFLMSTLPQVGPSSSSRVDMKSRSKLLPPKIRPSRAYRLASAATVPATTQMEPSPSGRSPRLPAQSAGGKGLPPQPTRPGWDLSPETQRNALQELADQNRSMREAAEILGVSRSLVAQMATKLKIRFHGRVGRRARPVATKNIKAAPKPTKRRPKRAPVNGEAIAKLLIGQAVSPRMQRRCPSCNQIFEPAEVSHYLCDSCDNGSYAAK